MPYIDTSILVAALTNEAATLRMQIWLGEQAAGDLTISEWVATEFSAALSIKIRMGQIEARHRAEALAAFTRLSVYSFGTLPISGAQFRTAARFADQHAFGLRAGDALHLAIAADHGATIVTLDRGLVTAAAALGVSARLV